jgi:hypothetical protein
VIFVIAALLAGLSGWLYAHMSRYVSPAPFDLRMGIQFSWPSREVPDTSSARRSAPR